MIVNRNELDSLSMKICFKYAYFTLQSNKTC